MESNLSKGTKAHPRRVFMRSLGLFLSLVLALPIPSSFALRQTGLEEQNDDQGKPVGPKAELVAALAPAAGMEEGKDGLTRREFLKSTGKAAALGALVGGVFGASAPVVIHKWSPSSDTPFPGFGGASVNLFPVNRMTAGFRTFEATPIAPPVGVPDPNRTMNAIEVRGRGNGQWGFRFAPAGGISWRDPRQGPTKDPNQVNHYLRHLRRLGVSLRLQVDAVANVRGILIAGQRFEMADGRTATVQIPATHWPQADAGEFPGEIIVPVRVEVNDPEQDFSFSVSSAIQVIPPSATRESMAKAAAVGAGVGAGLFGTIGYVSADLVKRSPPSAETPERERAMLMDFLAKHQSTIDLLTQDRLDAANLAEYFPEAELQELAQRAGYRQGLVLALPQAGLPSAFLERGIPVFVQEKWRDQVKASLRQAVDQGAIRFVDSNPAEAYLVIGEEKVIPPQPGQVFIGVNEQTVSRVTPGLLQELQQRGLLEPGSVVILYRAPKDSVLIFA